jgi:predicted  nucleic acid-binding Zn-ribbon protein
MTEDINSLKTRIDDLEMELEKKEVEIAGYLDRIENLELENQELKLLVPDGESSDNKTNDDDNTQNEKVFFKLKTQEKDIRDLKDQMGYLRKEKTQLQSKLEALSRNNKSVIRIEEKKPPLETLVQELQDKINKQGRLIEGLKQQLKKSAEYTERSGEEDF